jgi:hypothetical protein
LYLLEMNHIQKWLKADKPLEFFKVTGQTLGVSSSFDFQSVVIWSYTDMDEFQYH